MEMWNRWKPVMRTTHTERYRMMQTPSINDVIARVQSLMTINHHILISLVAFEIIVCVWDVNVLFLFLLLLVVLLLNKLYPLRMWIFFLIHLFFVSHCLADPPIAEENGKQMRRKCDGQQWSRKTGFIYLSILHQLDNNLSPHYCFCFDFDFILGRSWTKIAIMRAKQTMHTRNFLFCVYMLVKKEC